MTAEGYKSSDRFANAFIAVESGYVDDVIEPHETRPRGCGFRGMAISVPN